MASSKKGETKSLDLDDLRLYLHRRGSYLDQLVRLFCEKNASTQYGHKKVPLVDCIVVIALQKSGETYTPFVKMKYPPKVILYFSVKTQRVISTGVHLAEFLFMKFSFFLCFSE